jgi:capsule biosynthesis phosphatase
MAHDKRIVIDFDDTISIAFDRGWENASPNIDVVNKINLLYEKGWEIIILTARGQLSCQGNVKAADKKYRSTIKSWLEKHGVKYHDLSFNKQLAAYYVDDKALSPEGFVDLNITDIKTGWSGADIQRRNDRVYKTHKNSIHAAKWYSVASSMVNVPKVHSLIGQTICMEHLKSNGRTFKIDDIVEAIGNFGHATCPGDFETYLVKMFLHCEEHGKYHEIIGVLKQHEDFFNELTSFMHGDLSIENIIVTDNGTYLIDPLWDPEYYSSFLLDISKMMCSLRLHKRMFEYDYFKVKCRIKFKGWPWVFNVKALSALELSHFIRMLKYAPENMKGEITGHIDYFFSSVLLG